MRQQARFLEHVAERAAVRRHEHARVLPDGIADAQEAAGVTLEPGDRAQQRRLARAGRPEQRGHAASRQLERHVQCVAVAA
jgi:hypothetical protein